MTVPDRANARILVVDDEEDTALLLRDVLRKRGFTVDAAYSGPQALEYLRRQPVDVVVTDVQMPQMTGIELCAQLYERYPDCAPIVLTGYGRLDVAISAMRAGAYDFINKPVKADALEVSVMRALEHFALQREVKRLTTGPISDTPIEGLYGESGTMRELAQVIRRVATTDATVLITGESGTGKEQVARALHMLSPTRREHPFVAVNCGAMPASLLESELFGHVRGAFTDAKSSRDGLFVQAGAGTILLDEIGEMPLEMQAKLLRVLQERTVRPVGGDEEKPFEARVIAATNRELETEVEENRFREDLFHRINVVAISVPPLRARTGDVLVLANTFIERAASRKCKFMQGISRRAAQLLMDYDWPGNVRELENCIERAVALSRGNEIDVDDLPTKIIQHKSTRIELSIDSPAQMLTLDEMQHRYVRQVLAAVGGNKTQAAQILGIDRRSIYRRLEPPTKSESQP
ncbi:MAG: sigma-54-dependent Fis family transcriptional regulator [Deltaproteobacteria bacterium]|nr:sigma-54-dependent Fis family transcriptional regulator [Deltaproteobacteria bacterium]MDQ3296248.1 sigma-54 dependent transcriptional regulator [Myxococcota bacterium]